MLLVASLCGCEYPFFFSSRRRHTRSLRDWSSDVCSSDLAVVLTSGASAESFPVAGKMVWRVRRGIFPQDFPPRPVVFCGIARPQNFLLQLRTGGIDPVAEAFFRDHHAYTEKDIHELLRLQKRSEAGGFVTT